MNPARLLILVAFAVVLGVPLIFRPPSAKEPEGALRLVVITPHNEQIRQEFAGAFSRWHQDRFGAPVVMDWRQPGGTSEIRKQLQAVYRKALASGQIRPDGTMTAGTMPFDLLFGGGSYEHDQMKLGVSETPPGGDKPVTLSISEPMGFAQATLDEWFGENAIGAGVLYEPGQHWLGNALSGFGIVFNRDALRTLEMDEPSDWHDLADPRLSGWLALADPRQSGSVETTYNSILDVFGWDEGWKILRGISANARAFANSALKIPIDVSQGEAAVGVAIDFYGRYQSQAVMRAGETPETSRVGYIDPPGAVFIDPDPISLLRGGPNRELALRFVEFLMSEKGQSLWQYHARSGPAGSAGDELGPERYELRRMPIRRMMYEPQRFERFVDKVNPFEIAAKTPNRGWRSAIKPMMGSFAIDIHRDQIAAWRAMHAAAQRGAPAETLAEMERLFYAWPTHTITTRGEDGSTATQSLEFNEKNYRAIRADWREAEKDGRMDAIRIGYTSFFRDNYRRIIELAGE